MERYWARTTHDFDNDSREWIFRESLRNVSPEHDTPCGIHALDLGRWYLTSEIHRENIDYSREHIEPIPTLELVIESLNEMEALGMVKSKFV